MEAESETIRFVNRNAPCIPVPEVIYSWIDHAWNRSFLILKRIPGRTLRDAWPRLSSPQKTQIASKIAEYCCKLAAISSPAFENATHCGVLEPFFTGRGDPSHPSWKPRLLRPLPLADFSSYISSRSAQPRLDIGPCFHFYHADLGPGNIMVSDKAGVEGILDWESAGYYPRFWIATKPMLSAGFLLDSAEVIERAEWRDILTSMLRNEGYESVVFTTRE